MSWIALSLGLILWFSARVAHHEPMVETKG